MITVGISYIGKFQVLKDLKEMFAETAYSDLRSITNGKHFLAFVL